ncbi:MAG: helix-turn-helix transcriptional regulator [Verrucomicrobia bacterium]|nr:helix-turn-helix transcriptional regulator [Verrucomicrobiota bacterium]
MQYNETRTPFTPGVQALDTTTLRALAAELPAIYAETDVRRLPQTFVAALCRLVPGESHDVVVHDTARGHRHWFLNPAAPEQESLVPGFFANFHEFAPAAHRRRTGTGAALALSDFVDAPGLERLAIYREFYRPLGLSDDLSIHVKHGDAILCASVMRRRRGFSTGERELLNALRPHFKQAWVNAEAIGSLRACAVGQPAAPAAWTAEPLEVNFGLTPREAEVLLWVAQGKTNPEVAGILGITPHTVRTHLERVFAKLGVETRHAAGLRAMEVLGLPG